MLQSKSKGAIRVLFVGDIYGKPGIDALKSLLPGLLRLYDVDFCIVNGENAEQGKGIVPKNAQDIFHAGADVITGGNHTFYRDKIYEVIDKERRLLRPHNFPEGTVGRGYGLFDINCGWRIAVINLHGRALVLPSDDPFRSGRRLIEELKQETKLIFIDFHGEATAEKLAFARYVDGQVTAVIGTHTHVQTADEEVLAGGTAFISDAGMTGSHAGVIGMKTESAIQRFMYPMGGGKAANAEGDARLSGVIVDADPLNGKALGIFRVQHRAE